MPSASVHRQIVAGSQLDAIAVVERRRASWSVPSANTSLPVAEFAATLIPLKPKSAAVVPLPTSCTRRLPLPPLVSVSVKRSPSTAAVTSMSVVVVDRPQHVVDGAGHAQIDVGRVAGAIGDANLARGHAVAAIELGERMPVSTKPPKPNESVAARGEIVDAAEAVAHQLLRRGRLQRRELCSCRPPDCRRSQSPRSSTSVFDEFTAFD